MEYTTTDPPPPQASQLHHTHLYNPHPIPTLLSLIHPPPPTTQYSSNPTRFPAWLAFNAVFPQLVQPVQDLLKKIEADAKARLPCPPTATQRKSLARYRGFLKVETHRLRLLHRSGTSGRKSAWAARRCSTRCCGISGKRPQAACRRRRRRSFRRWRWSPSAVMGAAGVNPDRDVDFMFLHDGQMAAGKPLPYLSRLIDGVLYPLWDIGLKVGHSVRSMADRTTWPTRTCNPRRRLSRRGSIAGEPELFARFHRALIAQSVAGYKEDASRRSLRTRRRGAPSSAIPRACRSRTSQTAAAACAISRTCCGWRFQIPGAFVARTGGKEFVSDAERRQLEAAYDFCCARGRNCIRAIVRWTSWAKT